MIFHSKDDVCPALVGLESLGSYAGRSVVRINDSVIPRIRSDYDTISLRRSARGFIRAHMTV